MTATIVLGLVPTPQDAESVVNDLSEQGFPQRSVSVVTASDADARAIIRDGGPLRGTTLSDLTQRLQSIGMTSPVAQTYADGVSRGQALVAVAATSDDQNAASETLSSARAMHVTTVETSQ